MQHCIQLQNNHFRTKTILRVKKAIAVAEIIVDTGAAATVFKANALESLTLQETGRKAMYMAANGSKLHAKEVAIDQLTIGSIDLGNAYVWIISESSNLPISLLGVDILQKINFTYTASNRTLVLEKEETDNTPDLYVLCHKYGVPIKRAESLLPSHWNHITRDELESCIRMIKNMM